MCRTPWMRSSSKNIVSSHWYASGVSVNPSCVSIILAVFSVLTFCLVRQGLPLKWMLCIVLKGFFFSLTGNLLYAVLVRLCCLNFPFSNSVGFLKQNSSQRLQRFVWFTGPLAPPFLGLVQFHHSRSSFFFFFFLLLSSHRSDVQLFSTVAARSRSPVLCGRGLRSLVYARRAVLQGQGTDVSSDQVECWMTCGSVDRRYFVWFTSNVQSWISPSQPYCPCWLLRQLV